MQIILFIFFTIFNSTLTNPNVIDQPLQLYADTTDNIEEEGNYCNTRYEFCLEYPEEIFTQKKLADNCDGAFLASKDHRISLSIYGEWNSTQMTLADQHRFLLSNLLQTDGLIED